MSIFHQFIELREQQENVYKKFPKLGRLLIGPSGNSGLYIKDTSEDAVIAKITEEEAKFIINSLVDLYELK